jgi:hypothetical protein
MHALKQRFRLAAAAGLVVLMGCGSGIGETNTNSFTFGVSGAITGAAGVTVTLTGAVTASTTTYANGSYAFGSLRNGSYSLTPSKPGYTFNPANIPVTVNGGNIIGQNFTATTVGIAGAVSGAIADSVLVTLRGTMNASTTTAGGGLYFFAGLPNGSYTVTPSKAGYTFNPPSLAVTVNGGYLTGQNFVSTVCSPSLWTSVPSGTTANLAGIWGSGPNDVWAVGGSGTILHWNGSAWSSVSSCITNNLNGVWGSGANDAWAVGYSGTILERGP